MDPIHRTLKVSTTATSASTSSTTTTAAAAALVCLLVAAQVNAAPSTRTAHDHRHHHHQQQSHNVTVHTTSGLLVGLETSLGDAATTETPANRSEWSIIKFLAVPYARPPVGQLRFKRPLELPDEQARATLDARHYGKTCPQFRHLARFVSTLLNLDHEHQISEDCLQLNVFVPGFVNGASEGDRLEPNKRLPVIVWLPGEGFDFADARQFDGSHLALRTHSIVVTVQYRVGVLGFMDSRALGAQGNQAIHDQLMALRWVRRNIGALGGDPERVTLMGRFSGSMTISAMLTAPNQTLVQSAGPDGGPNPTTSLFKRAVLMSGIAVDDWIIEDSQEAKVASALEAARKRGFCTQAQIADGSCLQTMPVDRLLEVAGFGWKLVRDQQLIGRRGPVEAALSNRLPADLEAILLGETETEGTLCLYRHELTQAQSNYAQLIEEDRLTSGDMYEIIRDDSLTYFKYNLSATNPIQMALEALAAGELGEAAAARPIPRERYLDACSSYMVKAHNLRFRRNIQAAARAQERQSLAEKPLELYHYGLKYKPTFSLAPEYIRTAAHGDDVPLVFGLLYGQPSASVDPADLAMTQKMMAYIGNFVHGNQPLLQQHNQIETAPEPSEQAASAVAGAVRRSWTSGERIHTLDVSESELAAMGDLTADKRQSQQPLAQQIAPEQRGQHAAINLRLIVLEPAPVPVAAQQQQQRQPASIDYNAHQPALVLLLSSSIVILAVASVCILLSVTTIRCNFACRGGSVASARDKHSASSSRCHICCEEETPQPNGTSIEAVLANQASQKNERTFRNVFAKLKGHQGQQQPTHQMQPNGQLTTTTAQGPQQQIESAHR